MKLKFRSGRKVSQKPVIKLRLRIIKLLLWSIAKQKMLLLKVQTARRNQKKRKKVCILDEFNKDRYYWLKIEVIFKSPMSGKNSYIS